MNMVEKQKSKLFVLGIFPKCPFYKIVPLLIILVLIALGTWGAYYLNLWAAAGYLIFSLLFYFLVMPLTICKYCYFKVTETTINEETGKTTKKLLTIDKWSKSHLHKHVGQKNWVWPMFIIWFSPTVLIVISFFRNFDYLAIIALVGFIVVVVGNFFYMLKVKCPTCPIQKECHSSF
jgi:hypothetical protein